DDNDEIDAFLAIKISTCIEEGYYDSKGDIIFLENLLSHDTTHNLSPKVFFDHEPQQIRNEPENESLITFSPKSDSLHHEFAGELITLPPIIIREHEEYINHMMLLCGNSSSQSPENFHVNPSLIIESLLTSPIHVEDSDPVQEEIDIVSGLDDSTPPGKVMLNQKEMLLFETTYLTMIFLFHLLSPRKNEFGDRVKLCDSVAKNKALRGRHPMLILLSSFLFIVM
ncbi:hypothetical protein Tco_0141439, partial [Tanacetum coccineum]